MAAEKARASAAEIPLFPLNTVLFPDGVLPLRVFEPRYVDMVARCLRGLNRFGVVAIREGGEVGVATTYAVGTAAEIVGWDQQAPGVLGISAAGREGFRLLGSERAADGLYIGHVEWLVPAVAESIRPRHEPLVALLERIVTPLAHYAHVVPQYGDAAWVSGRLVELLPLALPEKQALRETVGAEQRLDRLLELLRPN